MNLPGRPGKRGHGGLPSVHQVLLALFCWTAVMVQFTAASLTFDCTFFRITNAATSDQLVVHSTDLVRLAFPEKSHNLRDAVKPNLQGPIIPHISGYVRHHGGQFGQARTEEALTSNNIDYIVNSMRWEVRQSARLFGWCDCTPLNDIRGFGQALLKAIGPVWTATKDEANTNDSINDAANRVDESTVMVTMIDVYGPWFLAITFFFQLDEVNLLTHRIGPLDWREHLNSNGGRQSILDFVRIALFDTTRSREYSFELSGFSAEVWERVWLSLPDITAVKHQQYTSVGADFDLDGTLFPWNEGQRILKPLTMVLPKKRVHFELSNLDNLVHSLTGTVASRARLLSGSSRPIQKLPEDNPAYSSTSSVASPPSQTESRYKHVINNDDFSELSSFLDGQNLRVRRDSVSVTNKKKEQLGIGPFVLHKLFEAPKSLDDTVRIGDDGQESYYQNRMDWFTYGKRAKRTMVEIKDVYGNGKIVFTLTLFWESMEVLLSAKAWTVLELVEKKTPDFVFFDKLQQEDPASPVVSRMRIQPKFWMGEILGTISLTEKLSGAKMRKQVVRKWNPRKLQIDWLRRQCDNKRFFEVKNGGKQFSANQLTRPQDIKVTTVEPSARRMSMFSATQKGTDREPLLNED